MCLIWKIPATKTLCILFLPYKKVLLFSPQRLSKYLRTDQPRRGEVKADWVGRDHFSPWPWEGSPGPWDSGWQRWGRAGCKLRCWWSEHLRRPCQGAGSGWRSGWCRLQTLRSPRSYSLRGPSCESASVESDQLSFKQSQQNVFNFSDKSIMCINVWYLGEILDVVCYFCLILEYKVHTSTSDVTKISLKITLLTDWIYSY